MKREDGAETRGEGEGGFRDTQVDGKTSSRLARRRCREVFRLDRARSCAEMRFDQ